MTEEWTDVLSVGSSDMPQPEQPAAFAPALQPPPAPLPTKRSPVGAIDSFEEIYRTSPGEFAALSGVSDLTPQARRTLAALLQLSAPVRDALVEVLTLPDETRAVVLRVLALPPEVRETLKAFLA